MQETQFTIDDFRRDLQNIIIQKKMTQINLAQAVNISQSAISNFLRYRRGLSCKAFISLWPFVYGCPFPERPTREERQA